MTEKSKQIVWLTRMIPTAFFIALGTGACVESSLGQQPPAPRVARGQSRQQALKEALTGIGHFSPSAKEPARQLAPRPASSRRPALIGPPGAEQEFGPEVKRYFDRLFCRGAAGFDKACRGLGHEIMRIRVQYIAPMMPWFKRRRPDGLPRAVLYPFSGGDIATSVAAFTAQRRFHHLSLEHGGPPDPLAAFTPYKQRKLRQGFVKVIRDVANFGFNFSTILRAQEKVGMPGILPVLLTGIRVHRGKPTGLRYFRLAADGRRIYLTRAELKRPQGPARSFDEEWPAPSFDRKFANLELRFRLPGDRQDRVLRHVSANLSDEGLKARPGVVAYLRGLEPHSLMIKANSWLFRLPGFGRMRQLAYGRAKYFITDTVDAPEPAWLNTQGFTFWTYGNFSCFRSAPQLVEPWLGEFIRQRKRKLAFRYGYQDCHMRNSLVVGLRRGPSQ